MKIFLTSLLFAPSIGGIETVSMLLAREFIVAGHEVRVATSTPDPAGTDYGLDIVREPTFSQLYARAKWCDVYFQSNISLPLARRCWWCADRGWSCITRGFRCRGGWPELIIA